MRGGGGRGGTRVSLCVLKMMPLAISYSHLQDVKSCDSTKRHFAVRDKKKNEKKKKKKTTTTVLFIFYLFIYLLPLGSRRQSASENKTNEKKKKTQIESNPPSHQLNIDEFYHLCF